MRNGLFGGAMPAVGIALARRDEDDKSHLVPMGSASSTRVNKAALGPEVLGTPQPQQPRGLFGGAANLVRRGLTGVGKWMEHETPNGFTNRDRLALMAASLRDDPRWMAMTYDQIAGREAREREEVEGRREQKSRMQLAEARRNEALQYGLDESDPLFGLYQLDPERALAQMDERQNAGPNSAFTRERVDGMETVFERFNPDTRQWEEVSRGPRWEPNSGGSGNTSMGGVVGRILDKMARGEELTPGEQAALERYESLQRRPDPFADLMAGTDAAPARGRDRVGAGRNRENPATPQTQQDFDALPSGAWFVNPADGQVMQKR